MCRRRRTVRQWISNSYAYAFPVAIAIAIALCGQPLRYAQQSWIWLAGVEYREKLPTPEMLLSQ